MKIAVLSDTHLTNIESCKKLAKKLLSGPFTGVEAVLHAVDIVTPELERCFAPLPWYSVRGNMDHTLLDAPISRVVELEQKRIGLIHGWGGHNSLEQRVLAAFADQELDALIYGHTHQPVCHRVASLLVMNPGSATDRRRAPHCTVGLLTLDEAVCGEIIVVD